MGIVGNYSGVNTLWLSVIRKMDFSDKVKYFKIGWNMLLIHAPTP